MRRGGFSGEVVIASGLSDYVPNQDNSYHAIFERANKAMTGAERNECRRADVIGHEGNEILYMERAWPQAAPF